jgi:hypothetical protein
VVLLCSCVRSPDALLLLLLLLPFHLPLAQAVYRSVMAAAAGRPDLCDRLANGLLLTGPAAGLRGLGQMLERRLMTRFAAGGRQQVRTGR